MAYLEFWLILVGGKAALMYGVWRLAKAQGRSPWPPLIATIFCASIVFLHSSSKDARNARNTLRVHKIQTDTLPNVTGVAGAKNPSHDGA
jgi:hypothetical protein